MIIHNAIFRLNPTLTDQQRSELCDALLSLKRSH